MPKYGGAGVGGVLVSGRAATRSSALNDWRRLDAGKRTIRTGPRQCTTQRVLQRAGGGGGGGGATQKSTRLGDFTRPNDVERQRSTRWQRTGHTKTHTGDPPQDKERQCSNLDSNHNPDGVAARLSSGPSAAAGLESANFARQRRLARIFRRWPAKKTKP